MTVDRGGPIFDWLRVDDPVGATSVHLVHGIFGTLCVGLFGVKGMKAVSPPTGSCAGVVRAARPAARGRRHRRCVLVRDVLAGLVRDQEVDGPDACSAADEVTGLDVAEMGIEAYPESPGGVTSAPEIGG